MFTYHRAYQSILCRAQRMRAEKIRVEASVGCVASENIFAKLSMPPFRKSAVDGYALKASALRNIPAFLPCVDLVQAGSAVKRNPGPGECVKIMTGAPLPTNTDCVIMVEETRVENAGIVFLKTARQGQNICQLGEDFQRGKRILKPGQEISLSDIALLAAAGHKFIKVVGTPKVAILNTGGEIVPLGQPLGKNKIYNSNGPTLTALLKSDGIKPQLQLVSRDQQKQLKRAIVKGLSCDLLLVSGGVSRGDFDLVPGVLNEAGVKEIFHRVNMKPGKPLFFGEKNRTLVFGIPGNPVSNFLIYLLFIRPALSKMRGLKQTGSKWGTGTLTKNLSSADGRTRFVPVTVTKNQERYLLSPIDAHGSADVLSLSRTDGFAMIGPNRDARTKNAQTKFITWKSL